MTEEDKTKNQERRDREYERKEQNANEFVPWVLFLFVAGIVFAALYAASFAIPTERTGQMN